MDTESTNTDSATLGDDIAAWWDARIAEAIEHQDAACAADATEAAEAA